MIALEEGAVVAVEEGILQERKNQHELTSQRK
jgi:hypothetical protein